MPLVNMAKREITFQILYYGIIGSGKLTNLRYIHYATNPPPGGEKASFDTQTEPAYIDLVTLEVGKVHDFTIRMQLYLTLPHELLNQKACISMLKRMDGMIFVADSQARNLQENIVCWNDLQECLRAAEKEPADVVHVMQWNKRDLPSALPVSVLEDALNPYQVPSYEAVAVTGKGVIECLRVSINTTLRRMVAKIDNSES